MSSVGELIEARNTYARNRLAKLRAEIAGIEELKNTPELCIYITGSYGRLEAGPNSDLDIFFLHAGSRDKNGLRNTQKSLIDADLIRACRRLGFPEFTGGGMYLNIHYLDDMLSVLGSPEDDKQNHFTARMLLLLESLPLHNEALYFQFVGDIVASYYRDYPERADDFRPIFLANDVVRYWKTMCLNYEHRRNRPDLDSVKRAENHLKNLKLKFSRLMMCFSLVIGMSLHKNVLSDAQLIELVKMSPIERLRRAASAARADTVLEQVMERYVWFLEMTGKSKDECLTWIGDKSQRDDAFNRGREFGALMFQLLESVADGTDTLRYLVM
jgi:Putative nucleotidyltransferase DUF294